MKNLAGKREGVAEQLSLELKEAGIGLNFNDKLDNLHEVFQVYNGKLCGWTFERAWYYWIAEGPKLPLKYATPLYHLVGDDVRVNGDCTCIHPDESRSSKGIDLYHVDTQEGLNLLAAVIKKWYADIQAKAIEMNKGRNANAS